MSEEKPSGYSAEEAVFAKNVKEAREQLGMSQEQLAQHMRDAGLSYVSQSTVSRIEKLTRPVRMMEAQAISGTLGVPVSQLIHPGELASQLANVQSQVLRLRKAKAELDSAELEYDRVHQNVWYSIRRVEQVASEIDDDEETLRQLYGYWQDAEKLERG